MLALFDLIHTLTKEEKRLYHLHGKGGRLSAIYDGYHKAGSYGKTIDQELYKSHFSDVSRAFYSMQKRELLDDLLFVLLQHSNSSQPNYQFLRYFTKGMILYQRQLGNGALEQLTDAVKVADKYGQVQQARVALWFQAEALMLSDKPTFKQFEHITAQLSALHAELDTRMHAKKGLHALQLLYDNHDELSLTERCKLANASLQELEELDISRPEEENYPIVIMVLRARLLHAEITGTLTENHRFLLDYWKTHVSSLPLDNAFRWEVLNIQLKSSLKAGDFLNLNGIFYKTDKQLEDLGQEIKTLFLPEYYETASLYYFYEKDLTKAQETIGKLLKIKTLPMALLERAIYYRLAMLVAAHLPQQAKTEIETYQKRLPAIANHPILWVVRVILALESHAEGGEILLMIERIKLQLRKLKTIRIYQDNLYLIEGLLEKKKVRMNNTYLFPSHWEQILRVDKLLLAKKQNSFYYNLLCEDWESRKQVF